MTLTCSLLAFMVATCCQASVRGSYRSMLVAPCKQESYSKNKNKHHKCNVDKETVNLILQLRKEFIVDAYLARVHAPYSIQVPHSCFAGTSASRLKQRPGNGSCEMNINSQVTCTITSALAADGTSWPPESGGDTQGHQTAQPGSLQIFHIL